MSEAIAAPSLGRILAGNLCTGCGLCAAISSGNVQMVMSDDGYLRPRQSAPLASEVDRLIGEVCPGIRLSQESREGTDHPLWGPIVAVRTGASTDAPLRHHASSGGALSGLLLYLLDSGTVDYVIQVTTSPNSAIENALTQSTGRDDVYRAAGSRYAPSAPLADLELHLAQPGRCALVGKPCDVAAVRALARHDPRVAEKIPVLLSFFCAGIPSKHGTRQILDKLGVAETDVADFGYRGDGWPGRATATLRDGRMASMSYAESWGDILSRHVQFRCKICPDGSGGMADIVCADAWHCDDKGYPLFDEQDGRSLIVTRTALGERLVQAAMKGGHLSAQVLNVVEIASMQPSQANRKRLVLSRLAAMALLGNDVPRYHGFNVVQAARNAGLWANLRSFLGMARRLVVHRRHTTSTYKENGVAN